MIQWRDYSEKELEIMDKLIRSGYGWREFALSVRSQGRISREQSEVLYRMYQKVFSGPSRIARSSRQSYPRYEYNFESFDYGAGYYSD